MGKSQELYERAKYIIPGATQLLSKRSERFAPGIWPAYYSRAKGCEVWDLDNKHYYDFATMGIGACSLGYANDIVNEAAMKAINSGNMCTLNCPEEIELAEKLISLHPWADMVRYARTGGEACSIAVRIARATTGRTKVAFCGYHGWHDWYISANLADENNLNAQLLPKMTTKGVPVELENTSFPFLYNDPLSLEKIFNEYGNEIACIIFEPQRGTTPTRQFLEAIAKCSKKYGAVIICDEVTSGFRMCIGGIHKIYNFEPDIAVFGKAIANGYAMAAIIGKKEVMENAEESFISSAFWTEKLGPAAAIASLNEMERLDSPSLLSRYGLKVNTIWEKAANENGLDIHISGIPPLTHLDFAYENNNELQTYYTQIMLNKGFLVGPSVYSSTAYSDGILDQFEYETYLAFESIAKAVQTGNVPLITKEIRSDAFKRLVY